MPLFKSMKSSTNLIKKNVIAFVAILIVACLIEIAFFNFNAISSRLSHSAQTQTYVNEQLDSNWEITGIDKEITSLSIESVDAEPASFTVYAKDQGSSALYYRLGEVDVDEEGGLPATVHLYGNADSLRVEGQKDATAQSLTINPAIPFDISKKRILIIVAGLLFVWAFRPKSKLYQIAYRSQPSVHIACVVVAVLLSAAALCCVALPWHNSFPEKVGVDFSSYEQNHEYHELALSLASGKLELNYTPSDELLALDNPYDTSVRDSQGVKYLWDHAYYQGKYYSYFGVLPALALYLPYHLITGAELSNTWALLLVALAYSIAIVVLLNSLFRRWFKQASLGVFLACFVVLLISTFLLERCCKGQIYEVALCTGGCCTLFALALFIRATDGPVVKIGLATVGTLLASFTLLSRPQFIFVLLAALVLLIDAIRQKKLPEKPWKILIVFIPLVVVVAFVGWYNAARFGSVFDFGASYNLTTNDMTKRPHSFDQLVLSFFSFLIQPISFDVVEPYLLDVQLSSGYLGGIVDEPIKGGLFAVVPAITLGVVMALVSGGNDDRPRKMLAVTLICCGVLIALFDGDGAGILSRYYSDFGIFFGVAACLGLGLLSRTDYFGSAEQTDTVLLSGSVQPAGKNLLLWIVSLTLASSVCMHMLSILF